jgi:glutamate carboxypeptidase
MKAGSFLAFNAVRAILRNGTPTRRPITLLLTPDEEVGSPTSRALIEQEGKEAACVLIPEPAGPAGVCVTARKGVGRFVVEVTGRGAHAGGNFPEGASAVVELARQIVRIHGMVDLGAGITLNAAPIWGGSRPNVIAPDAGCEVDLRVPTAELGERMERALLGLEPMDHRCSIKVTGGMNRPPMAETSEILVLYERAHAVARGLGFELGKQHRGGGSDGNFTAALGVPTLDGLGCPGAGAHASHEHIVWTQLAARAALLTGLLETL